MFLLQGPEPTDDDDVNDVTARHEAARRVAMASALRRQRQEAAEAEAAAAARANEDEGITWLELRCSRCGPPVASVYRATCRFVSSILQGHSRRRSR